MIEHWTCYIFLYINNECLSQQLYTHTRIAKVGRKYCKPVIVIREAAKYY